MASLNMTGPILLGKDAIEKQVSRTSPGNYALGYVKDDGGFIVQYVGRSDTDVNDRLKDWVGKYKSFKYSYATSAKTAFEKECNNFHDFGGTQKLANDIHPDRPNGSGWKCPRCKNFA